MQRYDVRDVDKWIDSFKEDQPERTKLADILLAKMDRPTRLEDRYLKVLRYMSDHPECDTSTDIRGAGDHTLELLAEKKVIEHLGEDGRGRRRYKLSNYGNEELRKMMDWERRAAP
jgi:hypothetical protein